jgi:hypothetical protein
MVNLGVLIHCSCTEKDDITFQQEILILAYKIGGFGEQLPYLARHVDEIPKRHFLTLDRVVN